MSTAIPSVLGAVFVVLTIASIIRAVRLRTSPGPPAGRRVASLATWWILAVLFALTLITGRWLIVAFLAGVSFLAFREFLALPAARCADRPLRVWAYASIPINYLLIYFDLHEPFFVFMPVGLLIVLPLQRALSGRTENFVCAVAPTVWGAILTVFFISHAALLTSWYHSMAPLLFLILLTEINDIAQSFCGRRLGRRRIAPKVSPNKTWEGLLGGIAATVILAVLLADLVPLTKTHSESTGHGNSGSTRLWSALAGFTISVGGFFGDLIISAVKRDSGVKDTGTLLPGQGGMLDRADSLTVTAPLFFYLSLFLVG